MVDRPGAQGGAEDVRRLILHWTAGTHLTTSSDLDHYHVLVEGDGRVRQGRRNPESNRSTADGDYAAHTRALNTGSIGVAVCAMFGAREAPFRAGDHAITDAQVDSLVRVCADLCETYGIPVTRQTVLTHAEVERTLGVRQRGKWDITWLPKMSEPDDAIIVGDTLRSMIRHEASPAPTLWQRLLAWLAA